MAGEAKSTRHLSNTCKARIAGQCDLRDTSRRTILVPMTLTIPNERIGNVKLSERDALIDVAIGLYKREQVSLGRAAEIAGISSPEFLRELGRRRIPINYDSEDLHADVAVIKRLQ
jgi:predicted HTH domain antitoxin